MEIQIIQTNLYRQELSKKWKKSIGYNSTKKERKLTAFNVKKCLTITIHTQSVTYCSSIQFKFTYPLYFVTLQKRIIRIMTGSRNRDSCRKLFTSLKILPFPSLYIFFLLRFVIRNRELFLTNNEIHNMVLDNNITFITLQLIWGSTRQKCSIWV